MTDTVEVPSPERIKADVEHIKEWLSKEPHLAHIAPAEDEEWLETFLYNNKFSLEKTKYKLENLYTLRSKYPEIFKNRDPTGEDVIQFKKCYKHVITPTKDNTKIVLTKNTGDPSDFNSTAYLKLISMIGDSVLLDKRNRLVSTVSVVDFSNFKPGHILKYVTVMGTLAEISEKAYTVRSKGIHVLNLPTYAQKFLETVMKYFSAKISERMCLHGSTNTLFEVVDEYAVCSDLGGKGPSIAELEEQLQEKMEQTREWFLNQGNLCSNEELRTKESKAAQEMKGSFRKLEVD